MRCRLELLVSMEVLFLFMLHTVQRHNNQRISPGLPGQNDAALNNAAGARPSGVPGEPL